MGPFGPTDCRELAPYVQNHDHGHDQRSNVGETNCRLEDDGVGQLNGARVAVRLGIMRASDRVDVAHQRAQGEGRLRAYRGEVAEAHGSDLAVVVERTGEWVAARTANKKVVGSRVSRLLGWDGGWDDRKAMLLSCSVIARAAKGLGSALPVQVARAHCKGRQK